MQPIKLFLAASKEDGLAAEAFESQLKSAAERAGLGLEVWPWYRDEARRAGETYLTSLFAHCRGRDDIRPSDFFAVILSDKDESATSSVFELGVFLGGLGFEPKRCFMLSGRGDKLLPEPLRGHAHVPFVRPANDKDSAKWGEAMKEAANIVRNQIELLRACPHSGYQLITTEMLMELECPREKSGRGQLTDEAEVLVNRAQPIEEDQQPFAASVLYNMKKRVKYRYFFHDKDSWFDIARLIHTLASIVPDPADPRKPALDGAVTHSIVEENLKVLQQQLSINLIPSPGPIEFCVHNVNDQKRAKCYLHYPSSQGFIEWCNSKDAVHIAKELSDTSTPDDRLERPFILRSTKDFNLDNNEETKKRLWNAIRKRFADERLDAILREACFEHLSEEETRRWKKNPWDELSGIHTKAHAG